MSEFVLDASVALSWCFEDGSDRYTDSILDALPFSVAMVPALWTFEVVNGLATAERRRRIREAEADEFLRVLFKLPIRVESESDPKALLHVARRTKLSGYDAAYLDLALRHRLPLATGDRQLRAAAQVVGVPVFKP